MVDIDDDGNTFFCWSFCGFLVVLSIPTAMIILGAHHIENCPMEPMIPKHMIVSGIATIIISIFSYCAILYGKWHYSTATKTTLLFVILVYLFMFSWNIAGSYWVFKEWEDWDNIKASKTAGCHNKSYLFAFSLMIIYWILFPLHIAGCLWKVRDIYEDV